MFAGRAGQSQSTPGVEEEKLEVAEQIQSMLLAAGYFKARLPSIKPFDKILGGMAWCISAAQTEVHIDFNEDMTMGMKIKSAEQVTKSLSSMGCPYPLVPHQLQGLDFVKIYPTIQWLVKNMLGSKDEMAGVTRKQAVINYHGNYDREPAPSYRDLIENFLPKRQFKTKSNRVLNDPMRIFSALLEFGETNLNYEQFAKGFKESASAFQLAGSGTFNLPESLEDFEEEASNTQKEAVQEEIKVSTANVAKMVQGHSGKINEAHEEYLQAKKEEPLQKLLLEKERHEREVANLNKQIEVKTSENGVTSEGIASTESKISTLNAELEELKALLEHLAESIRKVDEDIAMWKSKLPKELVDELEMLAEKKDTVFGDRRDLKEFVAREISKLQALQVAEGMDMREWYEKVDKQFEEVSLRFQQARVMLSEKNSQVVVLQRRLENTPSKTEMVQYQRRFAELYDLINLKLEENKKFFNNYNSLLEVRRLIGMQVDLVSTFQTGYKECKKKSDKEKFLGRVKDAIVQISENGGKADKDLKGLNQSYVQFEKTYLDLQEVERAYYKIVKEFQEEAALNDRLSFD